MISPDWCRIMAAYNSEMNRRIYGAADTLDDTARRADRGAFWDGIHGTLVHLLWGDTIWMSRFDGWEKPSVGIKDSPGMIEAWGALRTARTAADARIEAWAGGLTEARLATPLTSFSAVANREMTMPTWFTVAHFFNHQTHHRGQVHALLGAAGVATGDTDIPLVVDLAALGLA